MWEIAKNILAALSPAFAVGWVLTAFFLTYRQRAKLQAAKLKHDAEMAETRRQHDAAMAEVQHSHELDLTKRKHQYEVRVEEYTRFFERLDAFAAKGNQWFADDFSRLTQQMFQGVMENPDNSMSVVSDFMTGIMEKTSEANEELRFLRAETSRLRLIAHDRLLELLEELDRVTSHASEVVMSCTQSMTAAFNDPDTMAAIQEEMVAPTAEVERVRRAVMDEMRTALDAI